VPARLDPVGAEPGIAGDDDRFLDLRLRDQHVIERIAMGVGQRGDAASVPVGGRQHHEPALSDQLRQIGPLGDCSGSFRAAA
jgi:hypothetical protein